VFIPKKLNSLLQPWRNNPWAMDPPNRNYKISVKRHFDYLLGYNNERSIFLNMQLDGWKVVGK
jgi:hypothetical protein